MTQRPTPHQFPDQKDCAECREIRLGEPRCRWCLDKIYINAVIQLQWERDQLKAENEELKASIQRRTDDLIFSRKEYYRVNDENQKLRIERDKFQVDCHNFQESFFSRTNECQKLRERSTKLREAILWSGSNDRTPPGVEGWKKIITVLRSEETLNNKEDA